MSNMKYIIFDKMSPVIFSNALTHSDVARGLREKPTSAGFVTLVPLSIDGGYVNATVHGESISIGIKSNGDEDEKIIERFINKG